MSTKIRAGRAVTVAIAAAALVGACGSGDDGESTGGPLGAGPPASNAGSDGVPEVAVDYIELLGTGDVADLQEMIELAVDGSPAEVYARYHLAFTRYGGPTTSTTDVRDDIVRSCQEGTNTADDPETRCTNFGHFEVDDAGLLVAFSTDGSPIPDRLRTGDPTGVTDKGLTARVISAYMTSRGDLFIAVDVTNDSNGAAQVDDCSATYTGRDGRQLNQVCVSMQPKVQPGSTASIVYGIEQATLGGTLTITAATDERQAGSFYDSVELPIPIAA